MAEQEYEVLEQYLVEDHNAHMGYYFSAKKLFSKKTPFQNLEIIEVPGFGRALRLDGIFQTSEGDEFLYHEPLSHVPGISMNGPARALVIGGGDGGAAEELLKYNTAEEVVMIELDEDVVRSCQQYIPSISNGAFDDKRLDLRFEDGIKYIQNSQGKFDHILVDLTDPFGPSLALYTVDFYSEISRILSDKGFLSLHIEAPLASPNAFCRLYYTLKEVFKFVRPMFNYVPMYGSLWAYAACSNHIDPLQVDKAEITSRIEKLGLKELKFYNAETHFSVMAQPNYIQEMLSKKHEPVTMKNPLKIEKETSPGVYRIARRRSE